MNVWCGTLPSTIGYGFVNDNNDKNAKIKTVNKEYGVTLLGYELITIPVCILE